LQKLGCSDWAQTASFREVINAKPDDFSYATELLPPLTIGLAITLAVSLAVYGFVRAIDWVIGGFAAS
jgi:predicted Co/Zn/Cd cation transporter (cation efflux family)